jgi:hypothetical protein
MHATVRRYTGSPELVDALVANEREVLRILSEIDGFRAYHLVRTGDGAISISVYDDEDGADASNAAARAWITENLPDLSVGAPEVVGGQVVIDG